MQKLIDQVLEWGEQKGITGPNGKATPLTQAAKMMEEVNETVQAVRGGDINEVVDGIGDSFVTMTLLAERLGSTITDCINTALPLDTKPSNIGMAHELHYRALLVFERVQGSSPATTDRIIKLIGTAWNAAEYLAARFGLRPNECLQAAYDVISRRTGKMVDGTFVKDKEGA